MAKKKEWKYAVGRRSGHNPNIQRLVADPSESTGTTFVALMFDTLAEAQEEAAKRSTPKVPFFPVPLDFSLANPLPGEASTTEPQAEPVGSNS